MSVKTGRSSWVAYRRLYQCASCGAISAVLTHECRACGSLWRIGSDGRKDRCVHI